MRERRIARLQQQLKERIAEVLLRELRDPQLGLVTITRVELDAEFTLCRAFWSVLGGKGDRARNGRALERARGFVQREMSHGLHTRTTPRLEFVFDESIEGAVRVQGILKDLREEREARGESTPAPDGEGEDGPRPGNLEPDNPDEDDSGGDSGGDDEEE